MENSWSDTNCTDNIIMDPDVTLTETKSIIIAAGQNTDWKNAESIELNTRNQLGSKNREAHISFGAEYVLNPDGKEDYGRCNHQLIFFH